MSMRSLCKTIPFSLSLLIATMACAFADPVDDAALAKKLSNPLASMISVPLQFNYDRRMGPNHSGEKYNLNLQPVIPVTLDNGWTMISRTILPFNWQHDIAPGENTDFGIGDITQSLFFAPKTQGEVIWGIGPAFLMPTATDKLMGGKKWGVGPTGIVIRQTSSWTMGVLANQIWSVAGESNRPDISQALFQPFLAYHTPSAWTYTLNSEASYNWKTNEGSVPVNFAISKVVKLGRLPVSLQGGVGYWLDSPKSSGPEGWRFRTAITFVLPE